MSQNSIQIQIEEDFPDTHYFLYKNKKYPFKYEFFKHSSKYFSSNQSKFELCQVIPLFEEENEIEIDEDSINTFIQYVQRQKVSLNNENVCALNYLGNKFEVLPLISVTKNYISEHQNELFLKILLQHQNDQNFDLKNYELVIGENFTDYIDDERLLSLKIPILYRLLKKFSMSSKSGKNISEKINVFLFKILDKYGIKASPLFEFADFESSQNESLNLLLTKYKHNFDFHFINQIFLKKLYETQSEIIENDIKTKMVQESQGKEIELIKNEISRLKSEKLAEKEEQKQKDMMIDDMKKEIMQLREEINKMKIEQAHHIKEETQQIINDINSLKNQNKEIKDTQKMDKKSIDDQMMQFSNNIKQINEENENLQNSIIQLKNNFNDIEYPLLFAYNYCLQLFNQIEGEKQKSIICEMKSNNDDSIFPVFLSDKNIKKIENLLLFLSNEASKSKIQRNNINYIFMKRDADDENLFGISYGMTEILFDNQSISSAEFINQIQNFTQFIVEIQYPSNNYEKIYDEVLKLKRSFPLILKISIFITKNQTTNQQFKENKDIDYVKLDSCITKIESLGNNGSFEGCSSLKKITIPSSVTSIGNSSFWRCASLKNVSIPSSVTLIDVNSFGYCTSLTKIVIPSSIKEIKGSSFVCCVSLIEVSIPSSIITIRSNAFEGCKSLASVSIPSSVISIERCAFKSCTSLKRIRIPSSVKSIGNDIFLNCSSLIEITIPSSLDTKMLGINSNAKIIGK